MKVLVCVYRVRAGSTTGLCGKHTDHDAASEEDKPHDTETGLATGDKKDPRRDSESCLKPEADVPRKRRRRLCPIRSVSTICHRQ